MRLYDTEVHFQYTRLTIEGFDNLLRIVGPKIEKKSTHYRDPISERSRLYLTLRFLATRDTMSSLAFVFRIDQSTASMIIAETCESLWDVLQNENSKRKFLSNCLNHPNRDGKKLHKSLKIIGTFHIVLGL